MCSTPPIPLEDGALIQLIQELSNANPVKRASAAVEIFRRGFNLAQTATSSWFADPTLAGCFLFSNAGTPMATVGLAVERGKFNEINAASGSPRLAHVPDDQDAEEFELDFPGGVKLDILTTKFPGSGGAVDRFLRKFGEGVQQVEIAVCDVDRATQILRARHDIEAIYPQTRAGADGTRVNFFLVPTELRKILIELVERPASLVSGQAG